MKNILSIVCIFFLFISSTFAVEFDHLVASEPYFIEATEQSKLSNYGQGKVIAILDTGINDNNSELSGTILAEYDFTTNSEIANDTQGHGTKMASIIVAKNDGKGISGIAYNAKLIDVKVVDDSGSITNENIIKGIHFAVKNGANVINMSFASGRYSQELENAIDTFVKQGVIFVAAAGNDGSDSINYPAGYQNVIAVSALKNGTEEKAIYANYGSHISEWVEDGIWTYDGKKLSREYGTSESAAVISASIINAAVTKKNILKHENKSSLKYEIATAPTIENITFDALLESNDGTQYLNSLIKYIVIQEETRQIIGKLNDMQLAKIDKLYSHSLSVDAVNGFSNEVLSPELYARLFLFDLFGQYAQLMIPDYKEEALLESSTIVTIMESIDKMIAVLEGSDLGVKNIIFLNKQIKNIVLLTKGKKDATSKMIRKIVRIYAGQINSKDITSFKTSKLSKSIDNANNILAGLDLLKTGLQLAKELGGSLKKQSYMQIWAIDYVLAMNSMKLNNAFKNDSTKELNITAMNIITDAAKDKKSLTTFTDSMKYMGLKEWGVVLGAEALNFIVDKGLGKLEGNSLTISGLARDVIVSLLKNDIEEGRSVYKYNMYRNFLTGLNSNALTLQDNKRLGFIDGKYILTNIMSNIALKELTFHGFVYLKSAFKNPSNWELKNVTKLKDNLSRITLNRESSSYKYSEINTLNYIREHVTNSLALLPSAIIADVYTNVKFSMQSVLRTTAVEKTKLFDVYPYYLKKLSEADGSEANVLGLIFQEDFDYFMSTMTNYQKVLMDMYSASYVYDLISHDNGDEQAQAEEIAEIEANVERASEQLPSAISQDVKDSIRDSFIIGRNSGASLINKDLFENINQSVTRKDFMVMMMISALDEFNPFEDIDFLNELLAGKLSKNFSDIDSATSGNTLTTVEKIWILYAAKLQIINGYGDGTLRPFNFITRKEAFSLYGGLIAKSSNSYKKIYTTENTEERLTGGNQSRNIWGDTVRTEIVDYDRSTLARFQEKCAYNEPNHTLEEIYNLDETQGRNIKTAYLNNIFEGALVHYSFEKETREGEGYKPYLTHYVGSRIFELNRNLSNYESSVIAKRMFNIYGPSYSRFIGLPVVKGETSESNENVRGFKYEECFPDDGVIKGTLSLTKAYSNVAKELALVTKVTEANENQFIFEWETRAGKLDNFQRYIDEDGFLKTSISFTPKLYSEPVIIPVKLTIKNFKGEQASRTIYVQVLPSENYEDNRGTSTPSSQISQSYLPEIDMYTINWQGNSSVSQVTIYSSFDNTNWTQVLSQNQQQGSQTVSIANSKNYDQIYFKVESTNDANNSSTSNASLFYYTPIKEVNTPKQTEKPSVPQLGNLGESTSKSNVTLRWKRVNDSNNKDNVSHYEVKYADNYSFNNATIVNAGNNAAGENIYESVSFNISSLLDEKKYYFRVRAVNSVGTSAWSSYESIRINIEDLPYFDTSYQKPLNSESGTSKAPLLKWRADDEDGDDLEYYVVIGESPTTMNDRLRSFDNNESEYFDFTDAGEDALKPGVTYYWQVWVKEQGRDKAYYGDEYIKSPVWSFTTSSQGSDLAITNVELLNELKPDTEASFKVSIKNIGTEVASAENLRAYYRKNNQTFRFRHGGNGSMNHQLLSNETEDVIVTVDFRDSVTTYGGITYDNVLIEGDSHIIFDMPYLDDQDTNPENNTYEHAINYQNQGLPIFKYFSVGHPSVYNGEAAFDLYSILGENIGRNGGVQFSVTDDIAVTKATIEYRVNDIDSWHLITTIFNDDDQINEDFDWNIPEDDNFITNSFQVRVRAYENDVNYSERISYPYPIFSNKLNLTVDSINPKAIKVNNDIVINFTIENEYPLDFFEVTLRTTNRDIELYQKSEPGSFLTGGFEIGSSLVLNIPNDNRYASSEAYLEFKVSDNHGNTKTFESTQFVVSPNTEISAPFNNFIDIYNEVYSNFPSNTTNQTTSNTIKKLFVDGSNLVHLIVYHEGSWIDSSHDYHRHGKYLYLTYNSITKGVSQAIEVFDVVSGSNLPTQSFEDFYLIDNIPHIVTFDESGNKLELYSQSGSSFYKTLINEGNDLNFIKFENIRLNELYITYRFTPESEVSDDRRQKIIQVYPQVGGEFVVGNEYLSGVRVYESYVMSSTYGDLYSLDTNFNTFNKKHVFDVVDRVSTRSDFHSYNTEYIEMLINDGELALLKDDLTIKNIMPLFDAENTSYTQLDVTAYTDIVVSTYLNDNNEFKINLFDFNAEHGHSIIVGKNNSINESDVPKLVHINENRFIAIGNVSRGGAYLSVADFSGDILAPEINILNNQNFLEKGNLLTVLWESSDNENELAKYEVYEQINGVDNLLTVITDTDIKSYNYILDAGIDVNSIILKVVAHDINGNSAYAILPLSVFENITFESLIMDKTSLTLGDKVTFDWDVIDASSTTPYTIYKQLVGSDDWSKVVSVIGSQTKSYVISDFVGEYNFKIVSGNNEISAVTSLTVLGQILKYNESGFFPSGNYFGDNPIKFIWDDSLVNSVAEYGVYVKYDDEIDFTKIGDTPNKYYEYVNDGRAFTWKIITQFDGKFIESGEHSVSLSELEAPSNVITSFSITDGSPQVIISFDLMLNADSYVIAREVNGQYQEIDTISNNSFTDSDVLYGNNYEYSIISVNGEYRSNNSIVSLVETSLQESYSVTIDNIDNQVLSENSIDLSYRPNLDVSFESYGIYISTNPKSMSLYSVTQERGLQLTGLDYATTYFVDIYPLDYQGNKVNNVPAQLTFTTGFDNRVIDDTVDIKVNEVTTTSISLSWNAIENVDYYVLCRSENDSDFICLTQVTGESYVDYVNLQSGSSYRYKVKAVNGNTFTTSLATQFITVLVKDSDNDGVDDLSDAFPFDETETIDTDLDGIGNNKDDDDDGDGILDINDFYPLDSGKSEDNRIALNLYSPKSEYGVAVGQSISIPLMYKSSDESFIDAISFRLYFNSQLLQWKGTTNIISKGYLGGLDAVYNDAANDDNNILTDSYLQVTWFDLDNNWPGVNGESKLFDIEFSLLHDLGEHTSALTIIGEESGVSNGYKVVAEPINIAVNLNSFTLDINGDGKVSLPVDGFIILRSMVGFPASALASNDDMFDATRTREEMADLLNNAKTDLSLDINGDGKVSLPIDGFIILRHMVGFPASALASDEDMVGATRTREEMKSYLTGSQ